MSRLFEASSSLRLGLHQPVRSPHELKPAAMLADNSLEISADLAEAQPVTLNPSSESRLVALTDPDSLGSEKFRALVTRLDHMRKQREFRSLQVTSSVVHEGKTTVAANLGVTLAKYLGSRILMVEGDLHRPSLASLLGLSGQQGLCHWWSRRHVSLSRFLYRLNDMPLWFLAAGQNHDRPSVILKSSRFAEAFSEVAAQFDWIIVDSTPMLPIVDANLWSKLVDGTLLVVREGGTPIKALKQGLRAMDDPTLIGVVINEAHEFDQPHYDGEYYGAPKHRKNETKR